MVKARLSEIFDFHSRHDIARFARTWGTVAETPVLILIVGEFEQQRFTCPKERTRNVSGA